MIAGKSIMNIKKYFVVLAISLCMESPYALADTLKLVNPSNNHSYQRFDTKYTWHDAKNACIKLGAHLVTINNLQENNWVWGNLGRDSSNSLWLGGTNEVQQGIWTWVTGESWNYVNWYGDNEPNSPNYLMMRYYGNSTWISAGSPEEPSKTAAYVCEWETLQYISMTPIANPIKGKPSNYALIGLIGGTYSLHLINGSTGKKVNSVNIGQSYSLSFKSLSEIDDVNNDGKKDIAVLLNKTNAPSVLMLFSGSNAKYLKTINLPTK